MEDIKNAVATAIGSIVASGAIEKAISTELEKTIASIVKDQLRQYSDFGKIIEAKVKEALVIDPDRISFPVYNDVILQILQRQMDAYMTEQASQGVGEFMAKLLTAPPKEITLSALLKEYVEEINDDHEFDHQHFDLEIEGPDDNGYTRVKFGQQKTSRYSISGSKDFEFSLSEDGRVYVMRINDKKLENGLFTGPFYGFERTLFQMWLAKTKIVFDEGHNEGHYDTSFGGDD